MFLNRRVVRCVLNVLLVSPLLVLSGCGGAQEEPPKLVEVTGVVKYKGEPLPGASVSFVPKGQTKGTGAYGVTDQAGKYTLQHRMEAPGIEPGTYVVAVSKMALPDGSPIPEGKDAADVGAVQVMPPKYSDPGHDQNPNLVTVPEAGGEINLDLK